MANLYYSILYKMIGILLVKLNDATYYAKYPFKSLAKAIIQKNEIIGLHRVVYSLLDITNSLKWGINGCKYLI